MRTRLSSLAVLLACAFSASAQVTPILDCWREDTAKNQLTIVFGYSNAGATAVVIPPGDLNYVAPTGHVYDGQPTTFLPGTFHDVFTIAVPVADEANVSWTVDGTTVTLDRGGVPTTCTRCLCPAGDRGAEGPMGETGSAPPGDPGPIGPQGVQGPQGLDGSIGSAGPDGPQGPAGPTGPAGPAGPSGDAGPTGAAGPQGQVGVEGPAGPAGPAGPIGAVGVAGAMGPKGVAGDAGPAGAIGAQGPSGATGPAGPTGPAGVTGPAGATGPAGPIGRRGIVGPAGAAGPAGARGESGIAPIVDSLSLTGATEIVLESSADVVVLGSVAARAVNGGIVRVRLAGESFALRVPAGGEWLSVPLHAGKRLAAGRWKIDLDAGDGVELRQPSVSVLIEPASEAGRRRTVRR